MCAQRPFRQVDVFAARRYAGNPVAVVLDAGGLTIEEMERFTRWTNLSETAFVSPSTQPGADYSVRIFTGASPTRARSGSGAELSFAGHPTLGACHAWLEMSRPSADGELVLQECGAGVVPVRRAQGRLWFAAPRLSRSGPVEEALVRHIASVLRIDWADIVDATSADNGPGWVAVLLPSADAVLALEPGFVDLDLGVVGPHRRGSPAAFEVRAFYPKNGTTAEDPVTGSLNAALARWLLYTGRAEPLYVASQGTALGRSGQVHVSVEEGTVWVGGNTITCVEGHVEL